MKARIHIVAVVLLASAGAAQAQQQIDADAYLDKLRGMWMGQVIGNYAGRGDVPGTTRNREGYVVPGGGDYDVGWDDILATPRWVADDDTSLEYLYLNVLAADPHADAAAIGQAWRDNLDIDHLYIANRQARWLMEPGPVGEGLEPPQTGSVHRNMHFYAIDSQIATESLGALRPGMRQPAAELAERFATVTNDGYSVHAAQFYAAMYAAAAVEPDVEAVVQRALAVVPTTSRTHEVIQAVRSQYEADRQAGNLADPNGWRTAQTMLHDDYGYGTHRYRNWIESTVNVGLTTMALLYGQGDYRRTVEIGVLGGYDADCNPATAGGLIGLMVGYQGADGNAGLLAELPATPSDAYDARCLAAVGALTTVSQVAADLQAAAEAQIRAAGGSILADPAGRKYDLPPDTVAPPPEKPDPAGPGGMVGRMLDAGGSVDVAASVTYRVPADDRLNIAGIIDGITDVTYNGHLPYSTRDGVIAQPPGGDWYELDFGRPVTFRSLTFHEGDIVWNGINNNPRQVEPKGGFFLDLTVEVRVGGEYRPVEGLQMSEPLDANTYYQHIELSFEAATGDAVRIRGPVGGTLQFSTIVELEADGRLGVPGDADEDGDVDFYDYDAARRGFERGATDWPGGDFNFDGIVGCQDYLALKRSALAEQRGALVPEPITPALLIPAAVLLLRRRVRR